MPIQFRENEAVGRFLSDRFLKVPPYQRSYAWEKTHIQDLFEDIRNSMPNDYFIGTIVVTDKKDHLEIVDGQQRLVTINIFFVAVRDELKNRYHDSWRYIENNYLFKGSLRASENKPRISLNLTDNEFYIKRILHGESIEPSKESHRRLLVAYEHAKQTVNSIIQTNGIEKGLFDLIDFIHDQLKIVVVIVPDDVNAFTIFETLNDRGLVLSQTDLIKNYLFNIADKRLQEAQDKWAGFTSAIELAANEEEILQFIRYYWSSKNGLVREKDLFRSIKETIRYSDQAISWLSQLENAAKLYLALLNQNHEFWRGDACLINASRYISELLELELKQNRPLLLAILENFNDTKDIKKSLEMIVSWSVRNLITNAIPAGTLEREFSLQAQKINKKEITSYSQLRDSVSKNVPTDEEFKDAFKIITVSKSKLARYYLRKLEEYYREYRKTKELSPLLDPEKVNLEHILPESPSNLQTDWPDFDQQKHQAYYRRLGNLTLISKKLNEDAKNGSFAAKRDVYQQSEIEITKMVANYDRWTPNEIEQRQGEFAERAPKIWNI